MYSQSMLAAMVFLNSLKDKHSINFPIVLLLFQLYYYFLTHLKEVNVSALIIGIICTILLFVLKYLNQKYKLKFPIPAELIAVSAFISCLQMIRTCSYSANHAVSPVRFMTTSLLFPVLFSWMMALLSTGQQRLSLRSGLHVGYRD